MEPHLWTASLTENYAPAWPCPTCEEGNYILVPKSLKKIETVASRQFRGSDEWAPEEITFAFTAWLKCSNPKCQETAAVAGSGSVEQYWDDIDGSSWSEVYHPRFCFPMPDFFRFPKKCPYDVSSALRSAFSLFWSDPAAAVGRIRVSLERLMDFLSIPTQGTNKKGEPFDLSLHDRLQAFGTIDPTIVEYAMALKWLGNTGSHASRVSRREASSAFEIMDHILAETLDQRSKRIKKLADELSQRHDPKRKSPRAASIKRSK